MGKLDNLRKKNTENTKDYKSSFNDVKDVNIDDIERNPYQPRKEFNDESIRELAESIKENGLLQPISITKDNILIAGERRLRACKLLGFKKIKCILIKNIDDDKLERLAIIENLQREDLNIFDEALAINKLVKKSSVREVAKVIGKSRGYVRNREYLLALSAEDVIYIKKNDLKLKDMIEISKTSLKEFLKKVGFRSPPEKLDISKVGISNENMNSHEDKKENNITIKKKYLPSDLEIDLKDKYSNYGFEIFFDDDKLLVTVNKNKIDAKILLKALVDNYKEEL